MKIQMFLYCIVIVEARCWLYLGHWKLLHVNDARMDDDITIVIHHGGSFETKEDGEVVYVRDQIEQLFGLEKDTLDVFSIRNYYKLAPGRPLKTGLRALSHDKELLEMCFHAKNNEANSALPGQLNSAPPTQPHSKPQTKPTSNHPAQPTFEPVAQPKSKLAAQPNCSPAAQPTSTPPAQPKPMPLSKPCSSKPKTNKSEKSIPPTTTKKSTKSVKKNSKSTPKKGAVKKVPIPPPKLVVGEAPSVTLSSDSSDSYESAEDELYRPGPEAFENSSDDDSDSEVAIARPRGLKMKKNKAKGNICLEDLSEEDELIVQNSDEEVDLGQVIGKSTDVQPPYDAFDAYHDDSDGNDS
ncbi:hypothetical protein Ahy_B04g071724 [Arachis hypogaea]|uniref:PB1-like domain-containing protein n=1 Tax=Arachis hypogaea TaxID=3818 RepID=A0A444ZLE6_ARAHY|nr:hypothetical protein Ahy_B04g071724 [Arachis hypogaea]